MSKISESLKMLLPEGLKPLLREAIHKFRNKGFQSYVKKQKFENIEFDFLIADITGQQWYGTDWGWKELHFIKRKLVRPGDVVFDCGAHHGYESMIFSKIVGSKGQVLSFEALSKNAQIVQKNINLNGLNNISVLNNAVGSSEGKAFITGGSNSQVVKNAISGEEVETTFLDKFAHLKPTFLKIDVEGQEIEVLKGAKEVLKSHPKLVIEVHTNILKSLGQSVGTLFELIDYKSYEIWIQEQEVDEPKPFNGDMGFKKRFHLFALPLQT